MINSLSERPFWNADSFDCCHLSQYQMGAPAGRGITQKSNSNTLF